MIGGTMPAPMVHDSSAGATLPSHAGAMRILATTAILAILYLGRDILVPVTLAVILSLLIAPLVHRLRGFGLTQTFAVLTAVLAVTLAFLAIALMIGSQLVRLAGKLPQYETAIERKTQVLRDMTINRVDAWIADAGRRPASRTAPPRDRAPASTEPVSAAAEPSGMADTSGIATPLKPPAIPAGNSVDVIGKVLKSIWVPLETAGTVLVVLIFVLLEHDALRDRLIRIAGSSDIRSTTNLINDAGDRLSRFFVSQFQVNLAVGAVLWIGLAAAGLPHALLWAAMACVLRFVPYVGVWIAALFSTLFAAAFDPGWSLVIITGALFVVVELIAGQLVEPQLFGHTTGLSPLSVIIAAIFWSWLWGPIGLIVSTPLTLCLLVVGRHTKTLDILVILLGDQPALTMPQRFYQRALSGDAIDIIASARVFLKRGSFASYCDVVLMPAMQLALLDFLAGSITKDQQFRVRNAVVEVIGALGSHTRPGRRRRHRSSVLEIENLGRELRRQRERVSGKYQGPIKVPDGSVTLCLGLGSLADDLATELLVRVLREQGLDARHMSLEELNAPIPEGANPASVALVFIVSALPGDEREQGAVVTAKMRSRLPNAFYLSLYLRGVLGATQASGGANQVDYVDQATASFREAERAGLDWYRSRKEAS
jgi:predicted PurR-regulated permease PerM